MPYRSPLEEVSGTRGGGLDSPVVLAQQWLEPVEPVRRDLDELRSCHVALVKDIVAASQSWGQITARPSRVPSRIRA